jgi:hypothetical protein
MESARTPAGELEFGTGRAAKALGPACPRCTCTCSYRTKRRPWERLLGLRAFRCTVCSRRFAKVNREAEPWRSLRGLNRRSGIGKGRIELIRAPR